MKWILDENGEVKEADLMTWAKWFEKFENRMVMQTSVGGAHVSTVCMGIETIPTNGGPPEIFETMIFDLKDDFYQERYATKQEAIEGHKRAVKYVQKKLEEQKA